MPQATQRGTFLTIAESIRQDIESGKITHKLPSKSQLMASHGVSQSTIDRVLAHLKREGVTESVPGRGVFVAGSIDNRPAGELLLDLLRSGTYEVGVDLPSEKDLAKELNVTIGPLRTALAVLEGQGFIGRGANRRRVLLAVPPS